jgi:hypothetical protein
MRATVEARADTPPRCRDLAVSLLPGGAGLGHSLTIVALRNASSTACRVSGYARLTLYDQHGLRMPSHATRGSGYLFTDSARHVVVLLPNARASFYLQITEVDGRRPCPTAFLLRIEPPGARSVTVPFHRWISPCDNGRTPLSISSIHAGTPHALPAKA